MNEAIIERHNALIKPEDHWTCMGDVTMKRDARGIGLEVLSRLNGHKRLIMGNHDHFAMHLYLKYFEKVYAMNMYDNIRFTHIAIHPNSMGQAAANVHGHIHDAKVADPVLQVGKNGEIIVKPYINISMEMTDYTPVTLGQIKSLIQTTILKWGEAPKDTGVKEGFNLSTQHCTVCGVEPLESYRCLLHQEGL